MIETPFNYTGSKFKILNQILPKFDYSKSNFVDLFCGGGSVYTNVAGRYNWILANDIIEDLIGIHKSLIQSDDIIIKTKQICTTLKESQDDFLKLREDYNNNKSPEKLWALMLSCNSNLIRFNQKGVFNQTWGRRSWNASTEKKVKLFTDHIRKYKSTIGFSSQNFNEVKILKDTFYYMDPPYAYIKDQGGNISAKQISEAGYNNFYYQQDDINLYKYCHEVNKTGSTFMISGVLHHGGKTTWILDKLISEGFNFKQIDYNYEKINKTSNSKNTVEVIVKNF